MRALHGLLQAHAAACMPDKNLGLPSGTSVLLSRWTAPRLRSRIPPHRWLGKRRPQRRSERPTRSSFGEELALGSFSGVARDRIQPLVNAGLGAVATFDLTQQNPDASRGFLPHAIPFAQFGLVRRQPVRDLVHAHVAVAIGIEHRTKF